MADIKVCYCCTETLTGVERASLSASLSPDERERRDRFVFERDRHDFAVAHGLLRDQLTRHAQRRPEDWRFQAEAGGKPSIAPEQRGDPPLTFSLTHARGMVACAIARGVNIGIDVERIDPEHGRRPPWSCFSDDEQDMLRRCSPEERQSRSIELWTLKESYLKATGSGLHTALPSVSFAYEGEDGVRLNGGPGVQSWHFLLVAPSKTSRLALAFPDHGGGVEFCEAPHGAAQVTRIRSSRSWAKE